VVSLSKKVLWLLFAALLFFVGVSLAVVQIIIHDLPKLDSVEDYKPPQVSRVFDAQGHLIGEFFLEKRIVIALDDLPPHVKNAFLAAEDADFYHHGGVDYLGIVRAILNEFRYKLIGGQRIGGSTITQQTAKTMLLSRQQTYTRKIKEIFLAKRIEDSLTKNEILNLYLNQIYFGQGVYGIEEAAQTYYGVKAAKLTLAQAATLAAIPKSPSKLNPRTNSEKARARRDYVLTRMAETQFITHAQAETAKREPIVLANRTQPYLGQAPYYVEEVRRMLVAELGEERLFHDGLNIYTPVNAELQIAANRALQEGLRTIGKGHGYLGALANFSPNERRSMSEELGKRRKALFAGVPRQKYIWNWKNVDVATARSNPEDAMGAIRLENLAIGQIVVSVVTSISDNNKLAMVDLGSASAQLPMQNMLWARKYNPQAFTAAPKVPSDVLKVGDLIYVRVDKLAPFTVMLEQIPKVEGAIMAINPHTHRVLAMVGGYDFALSSFNRATQAKRQPGSAFKPFVYATAIEMHKATPASILTDAPKVYFDAEHQEQWKPKNDTGKFLGDITVRSCLIRSINTCSITLLERVGIPAVHDIARKAGMLTAKTPFPNDLSIALGSADIIPISFVNAYTVFPNQGRVGAPVFIEKVQTHNGEVLLEASVEEHDVLSPQGAFVMTTILKGVMDRGPGRRVTGLSGPLAGKTGTSNQARNAWFVGFSPDLVAGVYVGFDNNDSLGLRGYGAQNALPIWGNFMREALKVIPPREFDAPEGITWRLIDEKTGMLASSTLDPGQLALQTPPDDEDESAPQSAVKGGTILEAFIAGTEPKPSSGPAAAPLDLFEGGL